MDFINKISELEKEVARLKTQSEQEKAMIEVLPIRFDKNMEAFKKYIPGIYERFKGYKSGRAFRFYCNENGVPNLLWLEENISLYGNDPFLECKAQVDSVLHCNDAIQTIEFSNEDNPLDFIHVNFMNEMLSQQRALVDKLQPISEAGNVVPLVIMFGVGLGYQISYLFEQCQPKVFFIVEPDLDLFYASMFTFDWFSLFEYIDNENINIHIFLGQTNDEIINDIAPAMAKYGSYMAAASIGFWHYRSEKIIDLIKRVKQEFFILASGWGFFDDNIIAMSHCIENVKNNIPFLMKNKCVDEKWKNIPVFIVGNGPSLDNSIDTLKYLQDSVVIISCGSALSALHRAGIKPDIHVQVERTKLVPDTHALLKDTNYLREILFLSVDVIHPDCMKQFDKVGLAFKPFEPGEFILKRNFETARLRDTLRAANPLVGNTGLATACRLGFENIYLFGIDNGYVSDQHHHSKLSFYFDDDGNSKEKLSLLITQKSKHLVPGNFGGDVETTNMMINSKLVMENLIKAYQHVDVFNCSNGAAINGAKPTRVSDIIVDDTVFDKNELKLHIINDVYQPMDISTEDFYSRINSEFFDELIDKMVSEWEIDYTSRDQIIQCMMRQYEYMSAIRNSGYNHIYRCIIGSLYYSYSVILSTLYQYEESDELYKAINLMVYIMRQYFIAMKVQYKNALTSIDNKNHGLLD
ncbi:MAG: motility associated factor glycosyltransferase family protein [Aeromonas sobria]